MLRRQPTSWRAAAQVGDDASLGHPRALEIAAAARAARVRVSAAGSGMGCAAGTAGGMAAYWDFQMMRASLLTAPSRLASPLEMDAPLLIPMPFCRAR